MMKYIVRLCVVGVAFVLLVFAGCRQMPSPGQKSLGVLPGPVKGEPTIRMLWIESDSPVEMIVPGSYSLNVTKMDGSTEPGSGTQPVTISVSAIKGGIQLGKNSYKEAEITPRSGQLRLRYTKDGSRVEDALPGSFIFKRSATGKIRLILRMPLEQYLTGVLPAEMPLYYPPAALQAQAVAGRTYALYEIRTSQKEAFDVYSDVRSQAWHYKSSLDTRSRQAVNSTSGIVLTENNKLFMSYFHADCGGHSANGRYVFSSATQSALAGVDCPYMPKESLWKLSITKQDLSARLANAKICNGTVMNLEALDEKKEPLRTMGRVYYIRLYLDSGVVRTIEANRFRVKVVGARELKSTLFSYKILENGVITFEGRGDGHGVGLCQKGAGYLAKEGYDYQSILRKYYPGSQLRRLW